MRLRLNVGLYRGSPKQGFKNATKTDLQQLQQLLSHVEMNYHILVSGLLVMMKK